ncbi:hypothetical protein BUALT_Bualt16G0058700 [Buddleja alternifolia]|uniref:MULE transposase domain-containing protein n=1 Tax=Buddleja alternifolia TaxID=168488 RepID=A0AAV6WIM7_9LAMI|nr:hypothetical protein BUALT_Bualt16G0058700 [Buddleja alternifolia]
MNLLFRNSNTTPNLRSEDSVGNRDADRVQGDGEFKRGTGMEIEWGLIGGTMCGTDDEMWESRRNFFGKFYVYFDALKQGILTGCRIVIVVYGETKETWEWFLEILKDDLRIESPNAFTFISDKKKGFIPGFEVVSPGAENKFCIRHLHENFKNVGIKGVALKLALWNAATATAVSDYSPRMK